MLNDDDSGDFQSRIRKGEVPEIPNEATFLIRKPKEVYNKNSKSFESRTRRTKEGTLLRGRGRTQYQKTEDKFTYRKDKIPVYVEKEGKKLTSSNNLDIYLERKKEEKKAKAITNEIEVSSIEEKDKSSIKSPSPHCINKEDRNERKKKRSRSLGDDIQKSPSLENLHVNSDKNSVSSKSSSDMSDSGNISPLQNTLIEKPLSYYADKIPPPSMKWKHDLVEQKPPARYLENRNRSRERNFSGERSYDIQKDVDKSPFLREKSLSPKDKSPVPKIGKERSRSPDVRRRRSRTPPVCRSRTPNDRILSRSSNKYSSGSSSRRRSSRRSSIDSVGSFKKHRSTSRDSSIEYRHDRRRRYSSSPDRKKDYKRRDRERSKRSSKPISSRRRDSSFSSSETDDSNRRRYASKRKSSSRKSRSPDRRTKRRRSHDRSRRHSSSEREARSHKRKRHRSSSRDSTSSYEGSKRRTKYKDSPPRRSFR
uniref:NK-tumor recognition protein n=1 Tax=Parastrongyloides trichosuri TaxID=131310 RepID=A0A0N4ZQ20_PARTI